VTIRIARTGQLTDAQRSSVLALVGAATRADAVAPFSEQVLLGIRDVNGAAPADPHFLAYAGARLAGFAHLDHGAGDPAGAAGAASTAELVVDPAHRRQGTGTALVRALEDVAFTGSLNPRGGTLQIWSHGDLPGARSFAGRGGYSITRELWQMHRSWRASAARLPEVSLPDGFTTRHFVVGQDEDAWLRVNARAFADHPEQGRITRHDLDQRIAEPWFDELGFILIEDTDGATPELAASHWTKVLPADDPDAGPDEGEVYVVGVDPAYQGLGLGRMVTLLGLAHLRDRGLSAAMLYVDADNAAAVSTYSRLDFTRRAVDIMYSRTVQRPV
jgi:mycothiol synthase